MFNVSTQQLTMEVLRTLRDQHQHTGDTVMTITEQREEQLIAIQEKLESIGRWYEEYNEENEDNPSADYCSWGWKEGELYLGNFDDQVQELYSQLKELVPDESERNKILVDSSDLSFTPGIWANYNEIFSVSIGEYEISLEGEKELLEELEKLSDEEWEWIRIHCDYAPDKDNLEYMYGNSDGRWSLIVDEEKLETAIKELSK